MVSSPRARHGIENKKFLIVLRLLFMQNRGKDFYVELRLYCDSDARTRRRRLKRLFFFGGKVRSGTNGQGRWYACVLRRSKPSPNHLSCQLFLLVDYSWGLLFTTRMINDVRREAHVYMCNPFSFALACKYMKAIACWVEIGSTDAIWSCLFERREIFHFKARWLKSDDESGHEAAQWRIKNPTDGRCLQGSEVYFWAEDFYRNWQDIRDLFVNLFGIESITFSCWWKSKPAALTSTRAHSIIMQDVPCSIGC